MCCELTKDRRRTWCPQDPKGREHLALLTLEVRASNAPAIALYEKYGFVPVGRRKNYYDAPREDAVLMTLTF